MKMEGKFLEQSHLIFISIQYVAKCQKVFLLFLGNTNIHCCLFYFNLIKNQEKLKNIT